MKHYDVIEKIAGGLQPNIYVELGIFRGKTFNLVARHANKAYAVDVAGAQKHIKCNHAEFFMGTTQTFASYWNLKVQKSIDLIFIDADHSKESVLQDVKNFLPWLKIDTGLMVLHDTWPLSKEKIKPEYSGDCYLVPKALKANYDLEILTLPFLCGLTIIRKPGSDWRNG
jgi:hypothetical protein